MKFLTINAMRVGLMIAIVFIVVTADHPCPNACSGHGRCGSPSRVCECFEGFMGADCSLRSCPFDLAWADIATAVDTAHNSAECSNMGVCDRTTGVCQCRSGFEGVACERQTCPSRCNNLGECQSMYFYALSKDPGTGNVYSYSSIWDAQKIYGCACDPNYHGVDCSLRYCPKGDDPLTGTVSISSSNPLQYNEIQRVSCKADGGSFTLTFREKTSAIIPYNAKAYDLQSIIEAIPTIGAGNTKIIMYGPQACTSYGTSFTIEFLQNFGDLPSLVVDKRKLTYSNSLSTSTLTVAEVVKGTKENAECSNRGICDASLGVCTCSQDFDTSNGYNAPGTRGDCGYAANLIQYCPGVLACSAHGECLGSPTYQCVCSDGWTGADCSERLCPEDLAWFALPESNNIAHLSTYAECSNAGLCNRDTGECQCQEGFSGAACNRLTCPGYSTESEGCNGHGKCLDMSTLATLATINGDLTNFTYGLTPNLASTWDANRIFGCYCDAGYEGYDCSLMSCPFGADPHITGASNDQQLLACTDSNLLGDIILSFRQYSTSVLSAASTTSEVQAALELLPSVGKVSVETYVAGANNSLCLTTGNQFLVTFLTVHGDLPLITYNTNNIGTFAVTKYQAGTKQDIECSGRGLCDHTTGLCECFSGYGSSDGQGNAGSFRDCGYLEPIEASADQAT